MRRSITDRSSGNPACLRPRARREPDSFSFFPFRFPRLLLLLLLLLESHISVKSARRSIALLVGVNVFVFVFLVWGYLVSFGLGSVTQNKKLVLVSLAVFFFSFEECFMSDQCWRSCCTLIVGWKNEILCNNYFTNVWHGLMRHVFKMRRMKRWNILLKYRFWFLVLETLPAIRSK